MDIDLELEFRVYYYESIIIEISILTPFLKPCKYWTDYPRHIIPLSVLSISQESVVCLYVCSFCCVHSHHSDPVSLLCG
jgi:hypothetical protein